MDLSNYLSTTNLFTPTLRTPLFYSTSFGNSGKLIFHDARSVNPLDMAQYGNYFTPLDQHSLVHSINGATLMGFSTPVNQQDIESSYDLGPAPAASKSEPSPATSSSKTPTLTELGTLYQPKQTLQKRDHPVLQTTIPPPPSNSKDLGSSRCSSASCHVQSSVSRQWTDDFDSLPEEERKKLKRKRGNTESQARTRQHNSVIKQHYKKNDKLINDLRTLYFKAGAHQDPLLVKLFQEYVPCPEKERPKKSKH